MVKTFQQKNYKAKHKGSQNEANGFNSEKTKQWPEFCSKSANRN